MNSHEPRVFVSINTDYDPQIDLESRLRVCAAAGFTHVHWCEDMTNRLEYDDAMVGRIGGLLNRHGLSLLDMHGPTTANADICSDDPNVRNAGIGLYRDRAAALRKLGGNCMVIHTVRADSPALPNILQALDRLMEFCGEQGVRLALEAATESEAEPYFARYPSSVAGFCCDTGHCNKESPPTLYMLERYAGRLCATHLNDNFGVEDDHRRLFEGSVNWERIAGMFARMDYRAPLGLEIGRLTYLQGQYRSVEKEMTHEQFVLGAYRGVRKFLDMAAQA